MNCCDEHCYNHGCNQGRNCPARITKLEMGEPYSPDTLDIVIGAVAFVFMASCLGYVLGGWR